MKKKKVNLKGFNKLKKGFGKNWKKAAVFLGVVGLVFYFKSMVFVAFVNGRPISRLSFNQELEKQAGKQVLDTLVLKKLIFQEAKKQGVKVTDAEVAEEMDRIKEIATQQGMELAQLLELQGVNQKELVEEIKLNKIVEKIIGDQVEVTDEEVEEYILENAEFLSEELTYEEQRETVKEQLKQQKVGQKAQEWISELQTKAKIVNWL
ncbi:SurA N-terminal domain-containing protein [Patescibacteria group bacterium]